MLKTHLLQRSELLFITGKFNFKSAEIVLKVTCSTAVNFYCTVTLYFFWYSKPETHDVNKREGYEMQ